MTFLEGLLSFVSPCMLPMLPVYFLYLAGSAADGERRTGRALLPKAVAFALGFSAVFILLGVFAGALGRMLAEHRRTVDVVCAAVIALCGLSFLGVVRLPFSGVRNARPVETVFGAFAFGVVFSLSLTPCVGAFLGAALSTAASAGGAVRGAVLLAEYSLGLAAPFVVSAVALEKLGGVFGFFKKHAKAVSVFSGALLVLVAVRTGFFKRAADGGDDPAPPPASALSNETMEGKTMETVLNSSNFEAEVLKADRPVIVDFWAPWCGPCRMLAPELEALAAEKAGLVKVCKVNVDENPSLCAKYGIASIPAIFVFKNGKIAAQSVGYQKKEDLEALLNR